MHKLSLSSVGTPQGWEQPFSYLFSLSWQRKFHSFSCSFYFIFFPQVCKWCSGQKAEDVLCEHKRHHLHPADGLGVLHLIRGCPRHMHWMKEESDCNRRIVLQRCCFSWTSTFSQRARVPCCRSGGKVLALLDHHHLRLHLHLLHHHLLCQQCLLHTCWC